MNRKIFSTKFILLFILSILLCGCQLFDESEEKFPTDYFMGVIRTTEQKQSTIISFYNDKLECLGTKSLPYGTVGNPWKYPNCNKDFLYVNAAGLTGEKNLGISLGMNLNNGELKKYKHTLVGPAECVENSNYLFVSNNLNLKSHIVRCDKDTGETKEYEVDMSTINTLFCHEDILVAFAEKASSTVKSYILILDYNLNLIEKIDISDIGNGVLNTCLYNDILYFNVMLDSGKKDIHKVGMLYLDNYKVDSLELTECQSFDLHIINQKLYISDFSHNENGRIEEYDLVTRQSKIFYFQHPFGCFNFYNNHLFIVDEDKIYEYSIDSDNVFLEQEATLNTTKEKNVHYYVSGTFFHDTNAK